MTLYINPMRRTGRRKMMDEMMRDWDEGNTAELIFPIDVKADNESFTIKYLLAERPSGKFHRFISLPTPMDADKVEADLANGILTLQIPKAEAAKPHTIMIKQK